MTACAVLLLLAAGCGASQPDPLPPDQAPPVVVTEPATPEPSTPVPAGPSSEDPVSEDPASETTHAAETTETARVADPLAQWALEATGLPEAWRTSTGAGVTIAVVDTGVDPAQPDLAGKLVPGYDFVAGSDSMSDPNGHGTHVAGIAAATRGNGIGIAGAAPDAMIMPVRVLAEDGTGADDTIAAGIDWATTHGADVINLSLGESGLLGRLQKGGPINAAMRRADAAGVVVVAAAGNEGARKRVYRIGVPVIVVVATDQAGDPASFTNTGDLRAIAGPGVDIVSTAPTAPSSVWPDGTDGYASLSGTSMASPLVAGVAALLLAEGYDAGQVGDRLAETAANPTGDPALGAGILDAAAAVGG